MLRLFAIGCGLEAWRPR